MQIKEILIINNANESYGISTEYINQVSRVPSLMPLPLCPFGIRGLCSVGGNVASMVDMSLLLSMMEIDLNKTSTRLVSLNEKYSSYAILVEDVYNTVEIKQQNIEYLENEDDPVIAIYKYNDLLIQVLSLEELFSKINKVEIKSKEIYTGKPKEIVLTEEDERRFLIFSMSSEQYGLSIDYLQEIILADSDYTELVGATNEVLGLITLRSELLMVIDLRKYYGFEPKISDANRILIVSFEGKKVGLCIDSIIDIKSFDKKDVEYMNETFKESKISGVIHDENALISFFDDKVLASIFAKHDSFIDDSGKNEVIISNEEFATEVIVFKLAAKEYSFSIDTVDEIIDIVPATEIVFTDESVDGIINIRGQIITIVSLFKKLKIDTLVNENSKIIVCNINENRIGFIVDSVSDIISVRAQDIREEKDSKYFDKVLHLDDGDRLILSMDIQKIIYEN